MHWLVGISVITAGIMLSAGVFCLFMLLRNQWVYRYRCRILGQSYWKNVDGQWRLAPLVHLPDYDRMLWQVWKWNYDEYLNK